MNWRVRNSLKPTLSPSGSGGSPNRHSEVAPATKSKAFVRKSISHKTHFSGRFGATYFITICCHERRGNQLCREAVSRPIFQTATIYDSKQLWYLRLLLLMPDHLHALVSIPGDTSLSYVIGNFKRASSKFSGIEWQRNFFDHRLRGDESVDKKATYIRQNPVRAGLIRNEGDWLYVLDRDTLDLAVR